jgi:hypothetical protein
MKKLLLLQLLIIGFCSPVLALDTLDSLSTRLSIQDDLGSRAKDLLIGIHKDATEFLDTALGEMDLPQFPPPDELHAILFITDSSTMERIHSYIDFRPIPQEEQFVGYYKFRIYNLGNSFTISWSKIQNYIDSAYIRDIATGNIVNVDMKSKESFWVENYGMDQFNIVVYYNKNFVDVNENLDNIVSEKVNIYPNPVGEELKFACDVTQKRYKLINSAGFELAKGATDVEINQVGMSSYPRGLYFLSVEDINGRVIVKKFIKY